MQTVPHRIEVNVQTGEIRQIELTPEEIAALPPPEEPPPPPPPPPPPTRAELMAQLQALQAQILALPEE
jgi:hypothetical protein